MIGSLDFEQDPVIEVTRSKVVHVQEDVPSLRANSAPISAPSRHPLVFGS